MTRFFDLFVQSSVGAERVRDPSWADRHFAAMVQTSPFRHWHPGNPVAVKGVRVLLGVATWSGYDMHLLDVVADALARRGTAAVVEVFNLADYRDLRDLREFLPKLPPVSHSPVVGIWRDGHCQESAEGFQARDLVARMFGADAMEIACHVQDWIKAGTLGKGD